MASIIFLEWAPPADTKHNPQDISVIPRMAMSKDPTFLHNVVYVLEAYYFTN